MSNNAMIVAQRASLTTPCSAFTSWRAYIRAANTLSLAAHDHALVLRDMTFVLQQLFQISLERGPLLQPSHRKTFSPRQANHLHRCSATLILPVPLSCSSLVGRKNTNPVEQQIAAVGDQFAYHSARSKRFQAAGGQAVSESWRQAAMSLRAQPVVR